MAGWVNVVTVDRAVHTMPVEDTIEHELRWDGCPCGPRRELLRVSGTGVDGVELQTRWHLIHNSADGREAHE